MPNLVYSPGIRVYIQTEPNSPAKGKVLDVSDDVTQFSMQRRSDGVSSFSFTLANPNRKYDEVFAPNDRIEVQMKRITWLPVFVGFLNSVPLVTVWPRDVQVTASCTLKRIQYWYWDAYAPQTQDMIRNALATGQQPGDLSAVEAILQILEKVCNWPRTKVHIAQIPKNWFAITNKMATVVEQSAEQSDKIAQALFSSIGSVGTISGAAAGGQATGLLKGQTIDGFTGTQLTNAELIWNSGKNAGASQRDLQVALMAAMGAGNLDNKDNKGAGTGIYQFTVSAGNGTSAQLMNVTFSADLFFSKQKNIATRDNMSLGQEAATILGVGISSKYALYQKPAQDVLDSINKAITTAGIPGGGTNGGQQLTGDLTQVPSLASVYSGGTVPSAAPAATNTNPATANNATKTGSATPSAQPGTMTGDAFVGVAKNLVAQYPSIPYTEQFTGTRLDILTQKPPPGLDCSSFVQWVYLNAFGSLGPFDATRVVAQQRTICKIIDKATALKTPGALMFVDTQHVEISIGDGQSTIGAHHTGTFASIEAFPSQWTDGGLVPNVNYGALGQGGGTTGGAAAGTGTGGSTTSGQSWPAFVPYSSAKQGFNGANGYDKLFGNTPWQPAPIDVTDPGFILSLALTGLKTFLNDQPLLPYIKNLMNGIMRSFCSAPNGDLIGWFPDYYGLWGTAAKFIVEPIEVLDFNVTWNDEYFVTHQFVATTPGGGLASNQLDLLTGQVSSTQSTDPLVTTESLSYTRGIASVDVPGMMYALFGINMNNGDTAKFAEYITSKYGVRPNFVAVPTVSGPSAEFFMSVFYFMRNWSYQYNADVPLTFMPELWPGMLLQIPSFGFQAYVTTVTHNGKFGDGGQFNTTINIAAPARLNGGEYSTALGLLPNAAGINARLDAQLAANAAASKTQDLVNAQTLTGLGKLQP